MNPIEFSSVSKSRYPFKKGIWIILLVCFFIVILIFEVSDLTLVECKFKSITGYSCPSCGLTRSLFAMSELNISDALNFHLMGPAIFVMLMLLLLKFFVETLFGKEIKIKTGYPIIKIMFVLFFLVWFSYWLTRLLKEMI
jgi:hypothetical protein